MKSLVKIKSALTYFSIAITLLLSLAQCSDEKEILTPPSESPVIENETEFTEESDIASFTISGIYTEVAETADCATCTYVVDKNATVIDGKELGLTPGSVICLQKRIKYKALEFINLEGTQESPITISYCGN